MSHSTSVVGSWPALLTLENACRYLSLDTAQFLALCAACETYPVETGGSDDLWRTRDLDQMIKRLPASRRLSAKSPSGRPLNLDPETVDRIATAVAARLETSLHTSNRVSPVLVSIKDTAAQLSLGRSTIYQMINEGALSTRRIGGRTLVTRDSIVALLDGATKSS